MAEAALAEQTNDARPEDIDTQQAVAEVDAAPEPTVAELAAQMGHAPKDQWRGDPDKWKTPAEFLKTTIDINRTLAKDVKSLKEQSERTARMSASIIDQRVKDRLEAAQTRHDEAVEAGDVAAARAAAKEVSTLEATASQDTPEKSFAASNSWYGKDDDATAFAVSVSMRLAQQGKSVSDQLEAAENAVRKRFPELFEEKRDTETRKAAPMVAGTQSRVATNTARVKGASDLAPEARKHGEKMVREGMVKDLAAYAKDYWAIVDKENAA